ncbi:hypothetical protein K7X08_008548 [Anisodus acutangulus]|uniref:CASP-like protein n=1 Tax=Anisodus acutangulus TaxID=402998 RepID=A0A9Q1RP99_9SOLA|nr:hypothetical protein K7X08_008548 [Anisodus acutangulus]
METESNMNGKEVVGVTNKQSIRWTDIGLRFLAFVLTLVAAIVLGVDKQTELVQVQLVPTLPPINVPASAKWHHSSAFVYFVVVNAIALSEPPPPSASLDTKGTPMFGGTRCVTSLATREKIVAESTHYIKRLEEEVLRLENLKKSLLGELVVYKPALSQCRNRVSSVNVTVSKGVAFLGIQFQLTHGLMTRIFSVLDKHQAEVVAANISVSDHRLATLAITVMIGNNESNTIENIRRELLRF